MGALLIEGIIAFLPTFVVSRLLLWLTSRWSESVVRLVTVHGVSLALCVAVVSWVAVGNLPNRGVAALALVSPGQLAWLLIDAFRMARRRRQRGE